MRRNVTYPTFLSQSGKQHNKLRNDLQNDYTTGKYQFPNIHQATLHFLYKYSNSSIISQPTSEGAAFSQNGGNKYQGG